MLLGFGIQAADFLHGGRRVKRDFLPVVFLVDKADKLCTLLLDFGDVLIVAGNGVCVNFTPFGGCVAQGNCFVAVAVSMAAVDVSISVVCTYIVVLGRLVGGFAPLLGGNGLVVFVQLVGYGGIGVIVDGMEQPLPEQVGQLGFVLLEILNIYPFPAELTSLIQKSNGFTFAGAAAFAV